MATALTPNIRICSSMVERHAVNVGVIGSSPFRCAKKKNTIYIKKLEMTDLKKIINSEINKILNENRITKRVYRGGSDVSSEHYSNATFYTDSEIEAKNYSKYFHQNDKIYTKTIDFKNPLVLVKSEIGYGGLYDIFLKIFGEKFIPDVYAFPFNINDSDRNKIINYARNNGYDGIVMDDTDITDKNVIRSYIEI